jgi:hypothetical protein
MQHLEILLNSAHQRTSHINFLMNHTSEKLTHLQSKAQALIAHLTQ